MKRLFDIIVASLLLILLFAPLTSVYIAVCIFLGRPAIFRQIRPGLHGKPFAMYKFRTMTNKTDAQGKLLPDVDRLTAFGKKLRATSLDELPELWNVIKGDMSLVGPRPLLMDYLPLYSEEQKRRHEARPGITGWAQVNGRNAISWEQKFKLDVWYVDHQSFFLDIKILFMTAYKVVKKDNINDASGVTAEPFKGSK